MPDITAQPAPEAPTARPIPASSGSERTRLIERWIEGHNARDLEALRSCAAPDIEFHPLRLIGGANAVYVGVDGLRSWLGEVRRARLQHTLRLNELKETTDDQLVGHGSLDLPGSPDAAEFFGVYRLSDGLIAGAYHYLSDSRTMRLVGRID